MSPSSPNPETSPLRERRRRRWLRAPLLLVVVLGALPATQCLRQDEVKCEEAVAYLDDCCADFDPKQVDCYFDPGCSSPTYPTLSTAESDCIRGKPCDELRKDHVCERLRARNARKYPSDASSANDAGVSVNEEICR